MGTRHDDWPWPFKYIPRSITTFSGKPPRLIAGTADPNGHLDITAPGTWALCWPPYFTARSQSGWYVGVGDRWDYNTNDYHFPRFTIKHYKEG